MRLTPSAPVSSTVMSPDERNRHDIQNQLAVIHGFAELLLADVAANDPRRDDFEEIRQAAIAALDLLAHGSRGRRRPDPGLDVSKRIQ